MMATRWTARLLCEGWDVLQAAGWLSGVPGAAVMNSLPHLHVLSWKNGNMADRAHLLHEVLPDSQSVGADSQVGELLTYSICSAVAHSWLEVGGWAQVGQVLWLADDTCKG